jgi:hypothetical protein
VPRRASCAAGCPALLGGGGGRLTVHPCTAADARTSCARPCGPCPPPPAMLGTANGAGSTKAAFPGLRRRRPLASCCSGFCGRMPPERGPVWRGEGAEEEARRVARMEARQFAVSTRTCCQRTAGAPSRTRRAGGPEGAPSGGCFLWLAESSSKCNKVSGLEAKSAFLIEHFHWRSISQCLAWTRIQAVRDAIELALAVYRKVFALR